MKVFIVSLFISLPIFCHATILKIPDNIKLLEVDGIEQSFSFFDNETKVTLSPGKHILQVQYKELIEDDDNDDHATITSKPFVLIFDVTNKVEQLTINVPTFYDEADARLFAKKPKVTLVSDKGHSIVLFQQDLAKFQAEKNIKNIANLIANNKHAPNDNQHLPTVTLYGMEQKKVQPEGSGRVHHSVDNMAFKMLNYWWQQASEEQRDAFLNQVKQP